MTRERSGIPRDAQLIERAKAHDEAAWIELVRVYGPLVDWWLGRTRLTPEDRDDVCQDIFSTVARRLSDFRKDRPHDNFRGWLRVITRSRLTDHLRREGRQPNAAAGGDEAQQRLLEFPARSSDRAAAKAEQHQEISLVVRQALDLVRATVQTATWDAFWRVVVDGESPQHVAAELGVTDVAVRMAKSRVLRRLRELLSER
jgi:RNA polymerase sigma-70 factor (ECF subfamily)